MKLNLTGAAGLAIAGAVIYLGLRFDRAAGAVGDVIDDVSGAVGDVAQGFQSKENPVNKALENAAGGGSVGRERVQGVFDTIFATIDTINPFASPERKRFAETVLQTGDKVGASIEILPAREKTL